MNEKRGEVGTKHPSLLHLGLVGRRTSPQPLAPSPCMHHSSFCILSCSRQQLANGFLQRQLLTQSDEARHHYLHSVTDNFGVVRTL